MEKFLEIDLERLVEDGNKRSGKNQNQNTYYRSFGQNMVGGDLYVAESDGHGHTKVGIRVISQENAHFINLFGLSIDIDTGNVALGLFPDSDNYVLVENFFSTLSYYMFGTDEMPTWVDTKFILESLKLNPSEFITSSYQAVLAMYDEREKEEAHKYSSILMNIAAEWVDASKTTEDKSIKYFKSHNARGEFVIDIIKYCISLALRLEVIAVQYFTVFISENKPADVQTRMTQLKSLEFGDLLNDTAQGGNLECLYLTYIGKYNIPSVFLRALKSYGLGVKQRKTITNTVADRRGSIIRTANTESLIMVAETLSSMVYLYTDKISGEQERRAKVAGFNIIDLLKTVGWEESMLFSLDMVQELHNRSVYDSLVKRFSIDDLLLETKTTMKDFVMSLDAYRKSVLPLIDGGSLYTRKVLPSQYAMSVFSSKQIDSAGRVFDNMSKMILKKF